MWLLEMEIGVIGRMGEMRDHDCLYGMCERRHSTDYTSATGKYTDTAVLYRLWLYIY